MKAGPKILVDRRTTLRWLVAAVAAETMLAGCGSDEQESAARAMAELGTPLAPDSVGYGTDPDLMNPVVPWSRTMTEAQLQVAAALADIILPASKASPAASAVGVQDFIDEWVSAPYAAQQADREVVLDGLAWLEDEAHSRFKTAFAAAKVQDASVILDQIAYRDRVAPGMEDAARFFRKFRDLAMSAYYSTAAGIEEIGYVGNRPVAGPYPGPSAEALAHLDAALRHLGLA